MKPMLASNVVLDQVQYPVYASPKLDGIRATVIDGVVMSRSMKPIPNKYVQKLFGRLKYNCLDGELIVGSPTAKNVFQTTTSHVMSIDKKDFDVTFNVFDEFSYPDLPFEARKARTNNFGSGTKVQVVDQTVVLNQDALLSMEERYLGLGYEGVMLKSPGGKYKFGRSTVKQGWLLKLKRFSDSEARLTGVNCLYHNNNEAVINELGYKSRSTKKAGRSSANMLGAVTVTDLTTGIEFDIGSGFTEAQRIKFWLQQDNLLGKVVKYKYQEVGALNKPRFPVFLGFRDELDLGE